MCFRFSVFSMLNYLVCRTGATGRGWPEPTGLVDTDILRARTAHITQKTDEGSLLSSSGRSGSGNRTSGEPDSVGHQSGCPGYSWSRPCLEPATFRLQVPGDTPCFGHHLGRPRAPQVALFLDRTYSYPDTQLGTVYQSMGNMSFLEGNINRDFMLARLTLARQGKKKRLYLSKLTEVPGEGHKPLSEPVARFMLRQVLRVCSSLPCILKLIHSALV